MSNNYNNNYNVHEGVSCDGCGSNNFWGNRYKCLRCFDFDLCQVCYNGQRFPSEPPQHLNTHPMQMMLTQRDFEIIYEGDPTKNYEMCKIYSFTCPVCGQSGLTTRTFGNHISSHSYPLDDPVYCPLCIAYPGDNQRALHDLKEHIINNHSHLDTTSYRTEPATRAANRRPVLARRTTQRQPAGQAGTFTQQLGINLPLNWPPDDVDDMLRMTGAWPPTAGRNNVPPNVVNRIQRLQNNTGLNQLNQILHTGIHPNLPQIFGAATRPGDPQTSVQALQAYQQEQNRSMNAALGMGLARNSTGTIARSTGEYAQPRPPGITRQNTTNQPIARLLGSSPIFPISRFDEENMMSSDENAELTGDENDYISGEDELPALEQDSSQEEEEGDASTSRLTVGLARDRENKQGADTDSEFEFENPEDGTSETSENEEPTEERGNEFPTEREILNSLSNNTNSTEFTQLMLMLLKDPESDYEPENDDRRFSACTEMGDSLEEQLGKLVWSTIQFEAPPISSFGMNDAWNDSRFLRHRKLQRQMSCASTMEDLLRKADVVLSFLNTAAGKGDGISKTRVFDKPDKSIRRALKSMKLGEVNPVSDNLSKLEILPLSNGVEYAEEEPEVSENSQRISTVKFQDSVDDVPRPEEFPRLFLYGEEFSPASAFPSRLEPTVDSSEDEARSSAQDDDVDYIDDPELQH